MEISSQRSFNITPSAISNSQMADVSSGNHNLTPAAADPNLSGEQKRLLKSAVRITKLLEAQRAAHDDVHQAAKSVLSEKLLHPSGPGSFRGASTRNLSSLRSALDGASLTDHLVNPQIAASQDEFLRSALSEKGSNLPEIWKELAEMISKSETGELSNLAAAMDKYTQLYQAMTDVVSSLENCVRADGDSHMKVDFRKIQIALQSILEKYSPPTNDVAIAGKTPSGGMTLIEADNICKKLGLDAKNCLYKNGDGTFCVLPDRSQIETQIADLPKTIGVTLDDHQLSIAAYNVWKGGFDAQVSRLEDALQSRGTKYSNGYSSFENFHKKISAIIQDMTDMLRSLLQF